MKRSRSMAGLASAVVLIGCSSVGDQLADAVFIPNPNSDRRSEEDVSLELAFSDNAPSRSREAGDKAFFPALAGAPLAATAADLAISQIGRMLTAEAERYEANYSAEATSDSFYHYDEPALVAERPGAAYARPLSDIKFAGFKFARLIRAGGEARTALSICAVALPSRSDAFFQLIPVSYQVRYSKAKLIGFNLLSPFGVDLLNPWEIVTDPLTGQGYKAPPQDRDIDLTIAASFEYLWYSGDELTTTKAGPDTFDVKAVKVTGAPVGGFFPAYAKFAAAKGEEFALACSDEVGAAEIAALRDKIMQIPLNDLARMQLGAGAKLFPSAQRVFDGRRGNANFTVRVEVDEFDDYGARVRELSGAFDSSKDDLKKSLSDLLDGE